MKMCSLHNGGIFLTQYETIRTPSVRIRTPSVRICQYPPPPLPLFPPIPPLSPSPLFLPLFVPSMYILRLQFWETFSKVIPRESGRWAICESTGSYLSLFLPGRGWRERRNTSGGQVDKVKGGRRGLPPSASWAENTIIAESMRGSGDLQSKLCVLSSLR
jgi:hypothetical protein